MSLSRVKTWGEEQLTYADLNAEFNNILNNARDLISPATASWDMNGFELILDADADTSIAADTDDQIDFKLNGADEFQMTTAAFSPSSSDGAALGTASLLWADVFLASGAVINFNANDVTITHSAEVLTFAGAASGYRFDTLLIVNDTSNANMTVGVTINMGAADNEIVALKSSDVAHGVTTITETDTFGAFKKYSADGGLRVDGLTDTGSVGLALVSVAPTDDTAKSTSATGGLNFEANKISGTGASAVGSDGNLAVIRNSGTTRFIFDAEGSFHADVESTTFDAYDDLALIEAMDREFQRRNGDPIKDEYMAHLAENRETLQRLGIVNYYDPDGKRAMVNFTKQAMLHNGAIRQMHEMLLDAKTEIARLNEVIARCLPKP